VVALDERKKRKTTLMLRATGVIYGVASYSSWSESIYNPEMGITRNKRMLMVSMH